MEISDFDKQCIEFLEHSPNRHSKHCFRSALRYLERAEKLFEVDESMAIFACITAEEEAATGLMLCMKEAGYQNSDKLKTTNHIYKGAVIEFFTVLIEFVGESFNQYGLDIHLTIREIDKKKSLGLMATALINSQETVVNLIRPLDFKFVHKGKRFSYRRQIDRLVQKKGEKGIREHLAKKANFRNLVLYAAPTGIPHVTVENKFLPAHQARVIAMMRAYLLIQPHTPQVFSQDCLDSFLMMVAKIEQDDIHTDL